MSFTSPNERRTDDADKGNYTSNINELLRQIIAGSGAGMMTSLATCPLDVVKVRLQSQLPEVHFAQPRNSIASPSQSSASVRYRGTFPSLRRIWREEGLRGLYRGLGPSVLGYIPTFGIYFPTYNFSKTILIPWLDPQRSPTDFAVHVGSAMLAGATGTVLTNPLWVVRTRMITQPYNQPRQYRTSWQAARSIWRLEGWQGFYKGLGPSLLGVLHVVVQFPTYERLKVLLQSGSGESTAPDPWQIFLASTLAKMTASTVTYPHEVLRTRLQNQRGTSHQPQALKYSTILQSFGLIWREEGIRGFYRGLPTNLLRVVPASAVTFLSYELILQHLDPP